MAEQNPWRSRKALAQLLGEVDAIGDQFLSRDAGGAVLLKRSPRTTLVLCAWTDPARRNSPMKNPSTSRSTAISRPPASFF